MMPIGRPLPALVKFLLPVAASGLLGACALWPQLPPPAAPLLAPSTLGADKSASQVLELAFRDREVMLQCAVQVSGGQVSLIAVGPLGQRAFTLGYDGVKVHAELSPHVPKNLPPERVLADLQLALWPLAAWQKKLGAADGAKESEWSVVEPRPGLRRLRYRGRLIEEVHYADPDPKADPWNGHLWLVNTALGYTLDIQSSVQ